MQEQAFRDAVRKIVGQDARYDAEAYLFIRESLDYTMKKLEKPLQGKSRHISGVELLDGIRQYALEQFGPMTISVFREWGISCTGDFGEIVFNLVEAGELGKTAEDKREDFAKGYDFHKAFAEPFSPRKQSSAKRKPSGSTDSRR